MYVSSVEISNIRSLRNVSLKFPEGTEAGWHVVLGDNGSGKSTLVRAIALGLMGPTEAVALRQVWGEWLTRGETRAHVEIGGPYGLEDAVSGSGAKGKEPRYTARIVLDGEPTRPRNTKRRIGLSADRGLWSGSTGPGTGWFSASFGPFRRFTGGGREWEKLFYAQPRAGCHLSAFGEDVALTECLLWLQRLHVQSLEQKRDSRLLDSIRRFVNESGLLPHGTRMTQVRSDAVFFEDGSGVQISVDQLSDGFRSVLSMTFEILREMSLFFAEEDLFTGDGVVGVPGVVLIDEIDAHLHPTWQTRIGDWFRDAFPRVQFIVTTHSPLVCRAAEHDTIWRLRAPDDDGELSKIERIEGEQKARLVYGSVHQALESSGFQLPGIARSERGKEKMHRLAILNRKKRRETLSAEEVEEHAELVALFPQAASTEA